VRPSGHPLACAIAGTVAAATGATSATQTVTSSKNNLLDCNVTVLQRLCTDPHGKLYDGHLSRFRDPKTGAYVGHDEPSVKFISSRPGSGNTMSYGMQLSRDPAKAPTASGSVTTYGELSVAPWFGLPICDPKSYPQNACAPLSDSNTGLNTPTDAGSAFMELQFYPPGFAPFADSTSCSKTQWCSALNIDSLACNFNFVVCNNNCIEPVNFAFLQTNGVPSGPPAPQDPNVGTFFGNGHTLKMNSGDVLKVSLSDLRDSGTGRTAAATSRPRSGTSGRSPEGTPIRTSSSRRTWPLRSRCATSPPGPGARRRRSGRRSIPSGRWARAACGTSATSSPAKRSTASAALRSTARRTWPGSAELSLARCSPTRSSRVHATFPGR